MCTYWIHREAIKIYSTHNSAINPFWHHDIGSHVSLFKFPSPYLSAGYSSQHNTSLACCKSIKSNQIHKWFSTDWCCGNRSLALQPGTEPDCDVICMASIALQSDACPLKFICKHADQLLVLFRSWAIVCWPQLDPDWPERDLDWGGAKVQSAGTADGQNVSGVYLCCLPGWRLLSWFEWIVKEGNGQKWTTQQNWCLNHQTDCLLTLFLAWWPASCEKSCVFNDTSDVRSLHGSLMTLNDLTETRCHRNNTQMNS